jgi:uncharacterized protein
LVKDVPDAGVIIGIAIVLFCTSTISTAAGFGSAVIAIPLCSLFADVKLMVPLLALTSGATYAYLAVTEYRHVRCDQLGRLVIWCGLGFPIGNYAFHRLDVAGLKIALGIFVMGVALQGLWRLRYGQPRRPWTAAAGRVFLFLGGLVHGGFVSGGPLIVTYANHEIPDKTQFRATLCVVWVLLNLVFLATYFLESPTTHVIRMGLYVAPVIIAATWLGQKLHRAASGKAFQLLISSLLLVAGVALLAGSLTQIRTH